MTARVDYDDVAPGYERRYAETAFEGIVEAVLRFTGDTAGRRVLEIGCGTGHWLGVLDSRGLKLSGLHAPGKMLERAKVAVPSAALRQGDAARIPWDDRSVDRIFCVNAIHHFERKAAFISEAFRVLDVGGGAMVVGMDPSMGLDRWCVYDYFTTTLEADRRRYPSTQSVEEWMRGAGFTNCNTEMVHRVQLSFPAREALESGLFARATVSQLSMLDDAEYRRGLERMQTAIEKADRQGETLTFDTDLRMYATTGWKQG
jgi:SAM-dependent methyltransferase